jgi:plastocyanin
LLVVIPLAAGCGSSKSSSSSSPAPAPAPAPSPAPSGGSGGAGGAVAISMKNTAFSPTSQTVKVGQKVTWTNQDPFDHNVTATAGAAFKSQNFGQGGTYTFTAKKPGTIKYVCTIHPGMDGTLTVTK